MEKIVLNPLSSYNFEPDKSILIDTFLKTYRIKSPLKTELLLNILSSCKSSCELGDLNNIYNDEEQNTVKSFLKFLQENSIIIPYKEKVFDEAINISLVYGNYPDTIKKSLDSKKIGIISDHDISQIVSILNSIGVSNCLYLKPEIRDRYSTDFYFEISNFINDDYDLIIVYLFSKEDNLINHINDECYKQKKTWLPVYFEKAEAHIGPIIIPDETPCLKCLQKRLIENFEKAYEIFSNEIYKKIYTDIFTSQINNITAFESYLHLSEIFQSNLIGTELVVNLLDHHTQYNKLLFYPGCEVCDR